MKLTCPACQRAFFVNDGINRGKCPNAQCSAPYHFTVFPRSAVVRGDADGSRVPRVDEGSLSVLGQTEDGEYYYVAHPGQTLTDHTGDTAALEMAAHILSLPIQSLLADADRLLARMPVSDACYHVAKHISSEIQELEMIVGNILTLVGSGGSKTPPQFSRLPILRPLGRALQMVSDEAASKGCAIRLFLRLAGTDIPVPMAEVGNLADNDALDRHVLHQVLFRGRQSGQFERTEDNTATARILIAGQEHHVPFACLREYCFNVVRQMAQDTVSRATVRAFLGDCTAEISLRKVASLYIPPIEMDPVELELALKNILHNSVKYSYRGVEDGREGFIEVVIKWGGIDEEHLHILVRNYGVGITDEEIARGLIWEPRYRGAMSGDRHRTGAGLGLASAKRVIENVHGGKIDISSTRQAGEAYLTTVRVTLPLSVGMGQVGRKDDRKQTR